MKRDYRREAWLHQEGIEAELQELKLVQLDSRASLNNQARRVAVDKEWVELFSDAMRNGADFPPILVNKNGHGTFKILDGIHRWRAAEAVGSEAIAAYVVTVADPLIEARLTFGASRIEGRQNTKEEKIDHVVYLCNHGHTIVDAARIVGLSEYVAGDAVRCAKAQIRFDRMGDSPSLLTKTHLLDLNSIQNDNIAHEAFNLVVENKISSSEDGAGKLAIEINAQRSEQAQHEVIERWKAEFAAKLAQRGSGKKAPFRPATLLARSLATMRTTLAKYPTVQEMKFLEGECAVIAADAVLIAAQLRGLCGEPS